MKNQACESSIKIFIVTLNKLYNYWDNEKKMNPMRNCIPSLLTKMFR